ncbi:hypothetical protein [Lelliottia nimipressuralis]|uniref:hypothetical protein n=1 Tax=Lelliottia nimipressuralis TaxID=69220 RepID=UPI00289C5E43|nr:hypothetical protein [Lelliottia nimipressuralis]
MIVTNHGLLKLRILSPLMATVFAVVVYIDVKQYFMFPLVVLQVSSLIFAFKLKCMNKERSLRVVTRGGVIFIVIAYGLATTLGVFVSMNTPKTVESIFLLLFYVTCLDALMAIPFIMSFTDQSKWQRVGPVSGPAASSAMHGANGGIAAAYADSDYNAADYDWPQSDYHTSVLSSDSFDINPATGQTMVGMYDTSGCLYGYSDPVFTDNNHTNQFSDFDYHNNP